MNDLELITLLQERNKALAEALEIWELLAENHPFCPVGHAMEHCSAGHATRAALALHRREE